MGEDELSRFASGISSLEYDDFREAVSCLKRRYGFETRGIVKKTLLEEYPNFCKLIQLLDEALQKETELFNPHFYVLKYHSKELKRVREYLEEKIEKSNSSEDNQHSEYV